MSDLQVYVSDYLRNFKKANFRNCLSMLNPEVILRLDSFADLVRYHGGTVFISPASGSIFRLYGKGDHTTGDAIDVMIKDIGLETAFEMAKHVGFNAIGVYPNWRPEKGLHLGFRNQEKVSTWADLKKYGEPNSKYVSVEEGFKTMGIK